MCSITFTRYNIFLRRSTKYMTLIIYRVTSEENVVHDFDNCLTHCTVHASELQMRFTPMGVLLEETCYTIETIQDLYL